MIITFSQLFGVNYKDSENSALNFLNEYGNPFLKIGSSFSVLIALAKNILLCFEIRADPQIGTIPPTISEKSTPH